MVEIQSPIKKDLAQFNTSYSETENLKSCFQIVANPHYVRSKTGTVQKSLTECSFSQSSFTIPLFNEFSLSSTKDRGEKRSGAPKLTIKRRTNKQQATDYDDEHRTTTSAGLSQDYSNSKMPTISTNRNREPALKNALIYQPHTMNHKPLLPNDDLVILDLTTILSNKATVQKSE